MPGLALEELELEDIELLPSREVMCCPPPCWNPCCHVELQVELCVSLGCN
jgi:hypothetical protein